MITAAWFAAVLVADLGDGILARRLNVDTTRRRVLDAVVDRITIFTTAGLVIWTIPMAVWLVTPVIGRDVVIIIRNWWLLKYKWAIITPGYIQRGEANLYAVLFATVVFTTGKITVWVSIGISIIIWCLLPVDLKEGALVPTHPRCGDVNRYQSGGLRALRGHPPNLKNPPVGQPT